MKPTDMVYALPEEITLFDTQAIIKAGQDFLAKSPAGNLVFDLTKLTLLNSLTIGVMIKLNNLFKQKGRTVVLQNVSGENIKVLESTGLVNLFRIEFGAPSESVPVTEETVSLNIDFDIFQNIGVFHFGSGTGKAADTGLYLKTLDKIIHDQFKMLINISDLVSAETALPDAIQSLTAILSDMGRNIRIYCTHPKMLTLLRSRGLPDSVKVFASREEAVKDW